MKDSEITIKTMGLPSVFLMEATMPQEIIDALNNYLDKLLEKKNRESAADRLVGQIHRGEQLTIDHKDTSLKKTHNFLCNLGYKYISEFFLNTRQALKTDRQVSVQHLWSVHSYAGDYNPIHDHGTHTVMGVSCTTWTKVPEQISNKPSPHAEQFTYTNSSGNVDGFLEFIYGQNAVSDAEKLKPTQAAMMKPEVGKIYYFPSWLQHTVYPFRGEGERRTVAANFNCYPIIEDERNENEFT